MDINLGLTAAATGTADIITATYAPAPISLYDRLVLFLQTTTANTITAPTFNPNGLGAKTIVKKDNEALVVGDITGVVILMFDTANDVWVLLNPQSSIATGTLQSVTDAGNTTTNNIDFQTGVGVNFFNNSKLKEGTIDAGYGGTKGIAQICAVGYELKWEAGRLYVMNGNGDTIRHSLFNFTTIPSATDDYTKGYYVGSLWSLDSGVTYVCTDSTTGAATWEVQIINVYTLQQVTDEGAITTNTITVGDIAANFSELGASAVGVQDAVAGTYAYIDASGQVGLHNGSVESNLKNTDATNVGVILEFPNKGTGSYTIATTEDLPTGFVPYTGANANVDLGEYELKAGQLTLDITPIGTAAVGTIQWNDTIGSSETKLKGGSVILKNGVDLVARIVNKVTPNATLTKANYTAVRVSGATGQRLSVEYAKGDNDANSADTIGLVTETIATNQEGFIMTMGQLLEINTTGSLQSETWADGDVLYLSPTTAGRLTNIKPNGSTGHIVVMGYVEYAHAIHGAIYVKIMNGWELDELHNVYINGSIADKDILAYESATSLWKNKTANALGIAELASPTFTGTVVLPSTTSIGNVTSTELGYLDNVTSPIQTQLANAGEWIKLTSAVLSPADSIAYLMPFAPTLAAAATTGARVWKFTKSGTVLNVNVAVSQAANGTSELVTVYLRNTTTATDYLCGTFTLDGGVNTNTFANYSVSIPINTTDLWAIKIQTPAWVTNPTGVYFAVQIFNKA